MKRIQKFLLVVISEMSIADKEVWGLHSRISELESSMTELADKHVKSLAALDKVSEEKNSVIKKHLVAESRVKYLENLIEEMTEKYLNKVDDYNKVTIHEEELEKQEERLRLRQEELEDKLSAKSKELKKSEKMRFKLRNQNDELRSEIDGLEERIEELDELHEGEDGEQTYTEEDYESWNDRYNKEKNKRKRLEEERNVTIDYWMNLVARKDEEIKKLTPNLEERSEKRAKLSIVVID